MQVIEHQYLHYKNVLVYEAELDPEAISGIVNGIPDSLSVLGLQLNGKVIMTYTGNSIKFIIPVNESFSSNQHYQYKAEFKLVNAVRARHYGSFLNIGDNIHCRAFTSIHHSALLHCSEHTKRYFRCIYRDK